MLRLSKLTDYGIVVMAHLARQPERSHTAAEIAAALPLGAPTVSKLLKLLARGGLLVSQRGAKGGYVLARRAEEISVAQVISALEGPIALTECVLPGACRQAESCGVRGNWMKLSGTVYHALDGVSLAEMARLEEEAVA
jgi:FeS assembly SUF system regulator